MTPDSYTSTSDWALGVYTWRVQAKLGSEEGAWSDSLSLRVSDGAVTGMTPVNGSTTYDTTPKLSWGAVPGASQYQVSIDNTVVSDWENQGNNTDYTPTTSPLTAGKTYEWTVQAKDDTGSLGRESTYSLTVSDGAVTLVSPTDKAKTFDTTPELRWDIVSTAKDYQVFIRVGTASWGQPETTTANSYYTPSLNLGSDTSKTYEWKVQARDNEGFPGTASAEVHQLTVSDGAVTGMTPVNGSITYDTTPKLSWGAVPGAAEYRVRIDSGEPSGWQSGTSYTTPTLTGGAHTWAVQAKDVLGTEGPWSTRNLKVSNGAVTGMTPTDKTTVDTTVPTLSWDPVEGADKYVVQVANSSKDWAQAYMGETNQTSLKLPDDKSLTNNQKSYWRVQAVDDYNNPGKLSDEYELNVEWGTISGMVLLSELNDKQLSVEWESISGMEPSVPVILDPEPTISWDAVAKDNPKYEVATASTEAGVVSSPTKIYKGLSVAHVDVDSAISNDSSLYWRVRAVSTTTMATGEWSEIYSVKYRTSFLTPYKSNDPNHDGRWEYWQVLRQDTDATSKQFNIGKSGGFTVELSPYRITKYEITTQQFVDVMNVALKKGWAKYDDSDKSIKKANGNKEVYFAFTQNTLISYSNGKLQVDAGREYYPVTHVTWYGAMAFAHYLSKLENKPQAVDLSHVEHRYQHKGLPLADGGRMGGRRPFWGEHYLFRE